MKINISEKDGRTCIALDGMLDTNSTPAFKDMVKKLLDEGKCRFTLDLKDLVYTSSQGIRTILTLMKAAPAHGGDLIFTNIRPAVMEIFELSGLSSAMNIE